jgi:hypothetical protein
MKQENEKQDTAAARIVEDPANSTDQVSAFSGFFVCLSALKFYIKMTKSFFIHILICVSSMKESVQVWCIKRLCA